MEDGGHLPEHFHPIQEERWETLEGSVRLKLDGQWRDLTPEDGPAVVAPGVRH
jgi:quercetin dioxygenase-like cupin family protein